MNVRVQESRTREPVSGYTGRPKVQYRLTIPRQVRRDAGIAGGGMLYLLERGSGFVLRLDHAEGALPVRVTRAVTRRRGSAVYDTLRIVLPRTVASRLDIRAGDSVSMNATPDGIVVKVAGKGSAAGPKRRGPRPGPAAPPL